MDRDPDPGRGAPASPDGRATASVDRYWRTNLRVMAVLLVAWAIVGLGCGVLWADALNGLRLGGFPLGFWFAQQGSILGFVLLVLTYAVALNRLDARHRRDLARLDEDPDGPPA